MIDPNQDATEAWAARCTADGDPITGTPVTDEFGRPYHDDEELNEFRQVEERAFEIQSAFRDLGFGEP